MFARVIDAAFGPAPPPAPAKRAMPAIAPFNAGKLPTADMNRFMTEVNNLIEQYNKEEETAKKKERLGEIQKKIKEVDNKYPPDTIAGSPQYLARHSTLFEEIKYQYASLGTNSLIAVPQQSSPLSEIIANMSPNKTNELFLILESRRQVTQQLKGLYKATDESFEAKAFRSFMTNHQIEYLGGNNSKNYKVVNQENNHSYVLKVDSRLNMPRNVETHLRNKVPENFTPIMAERQVSGTGKQEQTKCRTLLVTEFCNQGNINEHRRTLNDMPTKIKTAGVVFEQMANILINIQNSNCMFPDAKASNWLVRGNAQLSLADTKSFVFTDKNGQYNSDMESNKYTTILATEDFTPPELGDSPISADAVHAYIMGKNLYNYLSNSQAKSHEGQSFDFTKPAFQTPTGQEYKQIIEGLVKANPNERMKVREALDRLFMINNPDFKAAFVELNALKFGDNDEKMVELISNKQKQINATPAAQRPAILAELTNQINALKADKATQEIRTIIKDLRSSSGAFTVGMKEKADRIETEMGKMPLNERSSFLATLKAKQPNDDPNSVMVALASKRQMILGTTTYYTQEGQIDTNKASQRFKDFKAKLLDQRPALVRNDEPEPGPAIKPN
ncbi:MAG: hypothetical protein P4L79_17270 [Legionella sp.]|uniref:protein kinase domain-containing protein n=1 Tax=Legionella sp. TaxID=459 RepID=UPI00284CBBDF|nr:hypothetical protein [Legionella sp.]